MHRRLALALNRVLSPFETSGSNGVRSQWRWITLSLILAATIALAMAQARPYVLPLQDKWDSVQDSWFKMHKGDAAESVFLELYDIDEATYRAWGSPRVVGLDRIMALIERARIGGAAAIMVDFDILRRDQSATLPHESRQFASYVDEFDRAGSGYPPLILTGSVDRPLEEDGAADKEASSWLHGADSWAPTTNGNAFLGSSAFVVDRNSIVRGWDWAELYCSAGRLRALPAIALLGFAAKKGAEKNGAEGARTEVAFAASQLDAITSGQRCVGGNVSLTDWIATSSVATRTLWLADQRTVDLAAIEERGVLSYRIGFEAHRQATKTAMFVSSAAAMLRDPPLLDAVNRVVLIGATYKEANDYHRTPGGLAPLPGVVVIANAIDSLDNVGSRPNLGASGFVIATIGLQAAICIWLAHIPIVARRRAVERSVRILLSLTGGACVVAMFAFLPAVMVLAAVPVLLWARWVLRLDAIVQRFAPKCLELQ